MNALRDAVVLMPGWFWLAVLGLLGLVVGSHLNVVVHRVPSGRSTVRPRSACPRCGHPIRWFDNVPVASWLALRGHCRDCGEPISARYPLVEGGTGILFVFLGWALGDRMALLALVAVLVTSAAGVALALIDVDTHRLPDVIVVPTGLAVATLLAGASWAGGDWGALVRAAAGGAGLAAVYFVAALVRPGAMGMGDVKLAGVLGLLLAWFGWGVLAVGAFAAFLLGALAVAAMATARRVRRGQGLPFGPFMGAGALVGVLAGARIWDWYLALSALS